MDFRLLLLMSFFLLSCASYRADQKAPAEILPFKDTTAAQR
jgi:hypothetical protein